MNNKQSEGLQGADKYTIVKAGEALAKFLTHLDTIQSEIGEYKKSHKPGSPDYIVTGMQITTAGSPVSILSNLDTNLEVSSKFTGYNDKPAIQVLKAYLETLDGTSKQYKTAVLDKFKGINNNTQIIVPFRIKDECIVVVGEEELPAHITSIIWSTNKETGKFQSNILAKVENAGILSKSYKIPLADYGNKFKVSDIERCMKISNIDRRTVTMDRFGFIKPVVIKDGSVTIAVDGSSLYLISNGVATIIGKWDVNGTMIETDMAKSIAKSKAYKLFKNNLGYIGKNIRYMAPYGLTEEVEIKL